MSPDTIRVVMEGRMELQEADRRPQRVIESHSSSPAHVSHVTDHTWLHSAGSVLVPELQPEVGDREAKALPLLAGLL